MDLENDLKPPETKFESPLIAHVNPSENKPTQIFTDKNNHEYQLEVIQGFLDNLDSQSTKDTYKMELNLFFSFLGKHHKTPPKDFSDLRRDHGTAYKAHLLENKKSPSTIRKKLSTVSSFCKYLAEAMILDRDIMYGIKRPAKKVDPQLQREVTVYRVFATDEIRKLFEGLDKKLRFNHTQYKAILAVGLYTGFRNQEVAGLKLKDLSFDGVRHFVTGHLKRGKVTKKILHPKALDYINPHLEKLHELGFDLNDDHYLFPSLKPKRNAPYSRSGMLRVIKKIYKYSGVDMSGDLKLSFHSLRATFATHLYKLGVPMEEIQRELTHSRSETTRIYCRDEIDHSKSPVFRIEY